MLGDKKTNTKILQKLEYTNLDKKSYVKNIRKLFNTDQLSRYCAMLAQGW